MTRIFRTLLLYLLMALLPLGGLAAVRSSCDLLHAVAADAVHDACADAGAAGHEASGKSAASHGPSGCGMCYAGPAAPVTVAVAEPPGAPWFAIPHSAHAHADFIPPGPERPPRRAVHS